MNGYCKILSGFFGACQSTDCLSDGFDTIEVYHDGNVITHGHWDTEEEAEAQAAEIHAERLSKRGQFGVGA